MLGWKQLAANALETVEAECEAMSEAEAFRDASSDLESDPSPIPMSSQTSDVP